MAVPVNAAVIGPYLNAYPDPGVSCVGDPLPKGCQKIAAGPFANYPSGNAVFTTISSEPTSENYVLGRMDYTLGAKDSLFGRYISDTAYLKLPVPFSSLPEWPIVDSRRRPVLYSRRKTHYFTDGNQLDPLQLLTNQ